MEGVKHSLKVEGTVLTVTGVTNIDGISDKEVVLSIEQHKIFVRGKGISAKRLDVEQGVAVLAFEQLDSISYNNTQPRWSFKGMFK